MSRIRRSRAGRTRRPGTAGAAEDSATALEQVAAVAERLAVLLTAGVSPAAAWAYLLPEEIGAGDAGPAAGAAAGGTTPGSAEAGGAAAGTTTAPTVTERMLAAAAVSARRGDGIAGALRTEAREFAAGGRQGRAGSRGRRTVRGGEAEQAWLGLAAAWQVATESGAPLASCLRRLAEAFRDVAQLHRDLSVALAGPRATARMVLFLPLVGLLFGSLLGFNTVQTLFLTVPGLVCLAGGGALMFLAGQWNARLVNRAVARDPAPGLELELMAIAVAGGGSAGHARQLVRAALAAPADSDPADTDPADTDPHARFPALISSVGAATSGEEADAVAEVLALSRRAGVPAAELLRSAAEQCRRTARTDGQRRAATLGVALMVPLGVCVLPAFMLVGVLPLLVSVLSATVAPSTATP